MKCGCTALAVLALALLSQAADDQNATAAGNASTAAAAPETGGGRCKRGQKMCGWGWMARCIDVLQDPRNCGEVRWSQPPGRPSRGRLAARPRAACRPAPSRRLLGCRHEIPSGPALLHVPVHSSSGVPVWPPLCIRKVRARRVQALLAARHRVRGPVPEA